VKFQISLASLVTAVTLIAIALGFWSIAVAFESVSFALLALVLVFASFGHIIGYVATRTFRGACYCALLFGVLAVAIPVVYKLLFPMRF
jgi:hypothetical protein